MSPKADEVQRWIKQQIMFDQATISCRALSKKLGCGIATAREHLEKFYGSDDAGQLKVKASYLVCGRDQEPVSDCTASLRIELADETELEDIKSKLASVSCVELHSIRATQPPASSNSTKDRAHKEVPPTAKPGKAISDDKPKSKDDKPKSKDDTPKTKKSTSSSLKKGETTDLTNESPVGQKKPPTTKKAVGTKPNTSKTSESKADTKQTKSTSSLKDSKSSQSKIENTAEKEESTKPDSTNKRTTEDVDEPNPLVRKRVTKTRIVQKKKKVRVKDIRGFRVTKEEIEDVEETYTDWESDPDKGSQAGPRKKAKKTVEEPEEKSNQVTGDMPKELSNPSSSQVKDGKDATEVKTNTTKKLIPKKTDTSKKNTNKDQSNITSVSTMDGNPLSISRMFSQIVFLRVVGILNCSRYFKLLS
ncbi:uncharacterized protein MELLADRAFT_107882 [Melampsora larici-populina 98AG31]|uniref:Uncharacterized protein n=1 Tax=Melampsora larici-populina (strain 98AG31 / pathotype 3-4-7) TaxID=747676 RepID=F4RR87_MELLP|nr:uncharacterized protein MELLADRAFT_107882 [Melampsora larici-populina 98AG31]EGG05195.1 hypothetical protein MELLADRAFT_107882 [Melampsora larici-populina 98AG31]